MNKKKKLILIGGVLLLIGLLMAFASNNYDSRVMGKASLGVAICAPDEGSDEWNRKVRIRKISEVCFWIGLIFTCSGVIVSTCGSFID